MYVHCEQIATCRDCRLIVSIDLLTNITGTFIIVLFQFESSFQFFYTTCFSEIINTSMFYIPFKPPHRKTNNLHRRKQRCRSASRFSAKLISAFVYATRIVQFLLYLTPKFQASSHLLYLYSPVCVGPVWKPHCWFSHEAVHLFKQNISGRDHE